MSMTEIINKVLIDKEYQEQIANSFGKGNKFVCDDCGLEEEIFLKFINECKKNKVLLRIFENIDYLVLTKENVTNKIFKKLIEFAKTKNGSWLWVSLTHAKLSEEQIMYLHTLSFLNESVFY